MLLTDPVPFRVASIPIPTAAFFRKQVGCDVQWISEGPDCLLASSSNFTVHLWRGYQSRLASPTCCSLASTPTINGGASSAKFTRPNDISWEDKKPVVYWRGVVQRRSFIPCARPDLIDARSLASDGRTLRRTSCTTDTDDCNRDQIIEEYNRVDREDLYVYGYKSAQTTSESRSAGGRYLGAVKEQVSFVFKSTAFDEPFPPGCAYATPFRLPPLHRRPSNQTYPTSRARTRVALPWRERGNARSKLVRGMEFANRNVVSRWCLLVGVGEVGRWGVIRLEEDYGDASHGGGGDYDEGGERASEAAKG